MIPTEEILEEPIEILVNMGKEPITAAKGKAPATAGFPGAKSKLTPSTFMGQQ